MKWLETDPDSGAEVYQLSDDPRPTENIYGEQPYSDPSGTRLALHHYPTETQEGALVILDLNDDSLHPVTAGKTRFPAFHAWGRYLYYQELRGETVVLHRCDYLTLAKEEVLALPDGLGRWSYGTVSQDLRWYVVSLHRLDGQPGSQVLAFDLVKGGYRVLLNRQDYLFKHEQFSRDGRNRVMIQANALPDVKQVLLGELNPEAEGVIWLPADRPHTPRPTGHEAWIGETSRILFSTANDPDSQGNVWTAGLDDGKATPASEPTTVRAAHVSVSRCGQYWVGDAVKETGEPLYIGSIAKRRQQRAAFSRTKTDNKQWSHTHPYLTADNGWLIYTSTRAGLPQVHGAKLRAGWLATL